MPRCSAAGLVFRIVPAGFNAPLEFLTGFTFHFTRRVNLSSQKSNFEGFKMANPKRSHLRLKHLPLDALTFEYQPIVLFSINQIVVEGEATPPVSGQKPLTT
jgi:hypothetical protein